MASATLSDWLARIEALHPKTIDMSLDRVRTVAQRLHIGFTCPAVIVGGTNGKGSTCTFLTSILQQAGYKVALHMSPHLVRFNERAIFNGVQVEDAVLVRYLEQVEAARGEISLTYFEFTLLAILLWFMDCQPDAVVLEVGLGGRLDAVNIIDADVSIVTSIDLDHMEYLGPTREHIGWEKAHIYRAGKPAICADPVPPQRLLEYASEIGADLWLFGRDFNYSGDKQQWSWAGRGARRSAMAYPGLRGANQLLNASAALAALEALKDALPVSQQAVRTGLLLAEIPGRFQVLPGRPTVILDVAHNPHAAAVLAQNLEQMGFYPYTIAVFGAMKDKDLDGVIEKLKPQIDHWLLTGLPTPRAATAAQLKERLAVHGITASSVKGQERLIETFDAPLAALNRARAIAGEGDRILVFGSFYTRWRRVAAGDALNGKESPARPSFVSRIRMAAVPPADPAAEVKTRARRTLIGAVILALTAVVVVPLVMDSKPRPWSDDVTLQIPPKDSKFDTPLQAPAAPSVTPTPSMPTAAAAPAAVATPAAETPKPTPVVPAAAAKAEPAAPKPSPAGTPKPDVKPAAPKAPDVKVGKVVLQAGAFTTEERIKAVEADLRKAGFVPYREEIETKSGTVTRVRFTVARDDAANRAIAKLAASGITPKIIPQ
jgi:dihydrofolate synthase / folylpolyglutamate synthase